MPILKSFVDTIFYLIMIAASEPEKITKISLPIPSIICYVDLHILVF
jgi:hypothetical protein